MKWRNILVVVVVAAVIVLVGLNFRPIPPGGKQSVAREETQPTAPEEPAAKQPPWRDGIEKDMVHALALRAAGSEDRIVLTRHGDVWRLGGIDRPPADAERVDRLLASLFDAEAVLGETAGAEAGTGPTIELTAAGKTASLVLFPAGTDDFSYSLAGSPGDETVWRLAADLPGDIGYWRAGLVLDPAFWLKKDIFAFDRKKLSTVDFESPGRNVCLGLDESGTWHNAGDWPSGQFAGLDVPALENWLGDLAALSVSGFVPQDKYIELDMGNPTHLIRFDLAEGEIASLAGTRGPDGRYYLEASTQPGQIYVVPAWRFDRYFRRIADIFPAARAAFDPADALFVDIRRDGLSVKLSRRGDEWFASGFPHPLRRDVIDSWLAALAYWRPLDSFDPKAAPAISLAAPTVEISLAGDSKRFRLGETDGRLGVSYVEAIPLSVFTADRNDAAIMFPFLEDVFDFSETLPGMDALARQVAATIEQNSATFSITSGIPHEAGTGPKPAEEVDAVDAVEPGVEERTEQAAGGESVPATAPDETPVPEPEETTTETPAETPVPAAEETPDEDSAETPAPEPEETTAETSVETSVPATEETPDEEPAETPAPTPEPATVEEPAETPVLAAEETTAEETAIEERAAATSLSVEEREALAAPAAEAESSSPADVPEVEPPAESGPEIEAEAEPAADPENAEPVEPSPPAEADDAAAEDGGREQPFAAEAAEEALLEREAAAEADAIAEAEALPVEKTATDGPSPNEKGEGGEDNFF